MIARKELWRRELRKRQTYWELLDRKIDTQKKVTDFFEKDYFLFVDATRKITEAARDLIWKYPGLTPKDAVHLASALEFHNKEKLDCVHSYDADFLGMKGKLPIRVEMPIPKEPMRMEAGVTVAGLVVRATKSVAARFDPV